MVRIRQRTIDLTSLEKMLRPKCREFSQLVEGKVDCKFGDYRHSGSSRFWTNFKKCDHNCLLKKWVNFAEGGEQRIRFNSKIKIPAPPLSLLIFEVSRPKIKFIVRGPFYCTPFAQQRISGYCGWLRSTTPRLKHLKKNC